MTGLVRIRGAGWDSVISLYPQNKLRLGVVIDFTVTEANYAIFGHARCARDIVSLDITIEHVHLVACMYIHTQHWCDCVLYCTGNSTCVAHVWLCWLHWHINGSQLL